jgi:hypothetical protein
MLWSAPSFRLIFAAVKLRISPLFVTYESSSKQAKANLLASTWTLQVQLSFDTS